LNELKKNIAPAAGWASFRSWLSAHVVGLTKTSLKNISCFAKLAMGKEFEMLAFSDMLFL
jgi:hypothetical protein